jgi:acetyl-CoA C-acetyltransferase
MTNAPYMLPKGRMGYRMGQGNIEDSMIHDGLFDELVPGHMAMTAENVAVKYGITRQECDELALISHTRCTSDQGRHLQARDRAGGTQVQERFNVLRER